MEQNKRSKATKTAIIILAILLCLSLAALGATLILNRRSGDDRATVTVPDNIITASGAESSLPSAEPESSTDTGSSAEPESSADTESSAEPESSAEAEASAEPSSAAPVSLPAISGTSDNSGTKTAASIELAEGKEEDNIPFNAENMFPGDRITQYYRVRVHYSGKITVHFRAEVRKGYEKLAEVLKVRVTLLSTGETLYDGLMGEMPESLDYKNESKAKTQEDLYYEITPYLETNVGNEYQNKELTADFKWWVEGDLIPPPQTGDDSSTTVWVLLAAGAAVVLLLLIFARRRKNKKGDDLND